LVENISKKKSIIIDTELINREEREREREREREGARAINLIYNTYNFLIFCNKYYSINIILYNMYNL